LSKKDSSTKEEAKEVSSEKYSSKFFDSIDNFPKYEEEQYEDEVQIFNQ
jgi:hypothetical protein